MQEPDSANGQGSFRWRAQASRVALSGLTLSDHISREALAIQSCRGWMDSIGVPNPSIVMAVSGYQDRWFPWCPVGVHVR